MNRQLERLSAAMLFAFAVVAGALGYWAILRQPALLAREDNPRLVEAERQIARGTIYDRDGRVVAESFLQSGGAYARTYTLAVGYYSLRYGVDGIEAAYDPVLRGTLYYNAWDRLLHRPQAGGDVRMTLDGDMQRAAAEALEGKKGALVVVEVSTGAVLALASSPTFDPNVLDEQWEALAEDADAPLLNRATQGRYQPGAALQTVILAAALEAGALPPLGLEAAAAPVELRFNGEAVTLRCVEMPNAPLRDIFDAYAHACPAPFMQIGEAMGMEGLAAAFARFGLDVPDEIDIHDSVGQGALTVSPAQMARVMAAVAGGGSMPTLYQVSHTRPPAGEWVPEPVPPSQPVLSSAAARRLFEAMPTYDGMVGHTGAAFSGPEGKRVVWFIGADADGRRAVAAVIEDAAALNEAASAAQMARQR